MATRREKVILELEDNFTGPMAKATAEAAALAETLKHLGGGSSSSPLRNTERDLDRLGTSAESTSKRLGLSGREIDRFSGRLLLAGQAALTLGPAFTAAAVPAVAGLSSQLGIAAVSAGIAVAAFQGVGGALKAMSDAHSAPTAANLQKLDEAMAKLGPDAQHLVSYLAGLGPVLSDLQRVAQAGLFPGVESGIDSLLERLPQVRSFVSSISQTMGQLAAEGGAAIAGPQFDHFFDELQSTGAPILRQTAVAVGNLAAGLAELWADLAPTSLGFTVSLAKASESFREWANSVGDTKEFQDFLAYMEQTGPLVASTLGSVSNALLQIAEAAAPLGGPTLSIIKSIADAVAAIADSPIGPPLIQMAVAMSALSRASRLMQSTSVGQTLFGGKGLQVKGFGKGTLAIAGLAAATSGLTDKFGLTNAATLAMAGSMAGPWGAAVGAGVGLVLDLSHANDGLAKSVGTAQKALAQQSTLTVAQLKQQAAAAEQAADKAASFGGTMKTLGAAFGDVLKLNPGAAAKTVEDLNRVTKAANDLRYAATERSAKGGAAGLLAQGIPGLRQTASEFDRASVAASGFGAAVGEVERKISNTGSFLDVKQALIDLQNAFKDNGANVDTSTQKGINNLRTLQDAMSAVAARASVIQDPLQKIKFVDNVTPKLVAMANKMDTTGRTGRELKTQLDKLSGKTNIDVDANTGAADRKLKNTKQGVDALSKVKGKIKVDADTGAAVSKLQGTSKLFDFLVGQVGGPKVIANTGGANKNLHGTTSLYNFLADQVGGPTVTAKDLATPKMRGINAYHIDDKSFTITEFHKVISQTVKKFEPKNLLADGGRVIGPGGPRDDRIPAMLSNGEFVVNAAAAARFRRELEWMNAHRYANGGAVGRAPSVTVGSPSVRVGGTRIQVLIDGQAVRHIVREERAADRDMDGIRSTSGSRGANL